MGGWRPMIFMFHGLVVAMFMLIGASAAIILMRTKDKLVRFSAQAFAGYQVVQLVQHHFVLFILLISLVLDSLLT
jgi:hypothetical protein